MNKTIWKTVFFIALTVFTVLTALLIAFIYTMITTPLSLPETSIIGGADLPTFHFLLQQILKGPIFYIWFGSFLTVVISLIGWLTVRNQSASKKETM